jgi:hypothetical protein
MKPMTAIYWCEHHKSTVVVLTYIVEEVLTGLWLLLGQDKHWLNRRLPTVASLLTKMAALYTIYLNLAAVSGN